VLQNRAFQQVTPGNSFFASEMEDIIRMLCYLGTASALAGWQSLGGNISVIRETVPVSSALPNALQLTLPAGEANGVGFANTGYSGTKYICPKRSSPGLTTIL
jgi:alpha-L-arabinofuranosidase